MIKRTQFGLLLVTVIGMGLSSVSADDWLHWRGPTQDGISAETGLVTKWTVDDALWMDKETGGRATPIILNDRVYLNCRTADNVNDPEEKINARQQVVCWDAKTGKVLWRDVFNVFLTDIASPRVGWAAMCGDKETGNVYVFTVDGIFRCYEGETGKVVWEHSMLEKYGAISGYGGRTQSPIIDEDRVIISMLAANWGIYKGPSPKQYYFAFDKKSGQLNWISGPGEAPVDTNQSVPIVAVFGGQRMLIGGNSNGSVYAINARTGKPIWEFKMSLRGLNASPTTDGKYIYISHGEDNIDNEKFGRIQCIDPNGSGDITKTNSVWRYDGLKAGFCGLLIKDGVLYVLSDTGNLHGFDAANGELLWVQDLGTVGKSAPVWADGYMYVTEVNGNIYTLKCDRKGCEVINHVELKAVNGEGSDEIYASPAISNGRMILVTRDRTICLAGKDASTSPSVGHTMAAEADVEQEIDLVQLRPYELVLREGDTAEFELHAFDKHGRFIKKLSPKLSAGEGLDPVTVDGNKISVGKASRDFAGELTAGIDGKMATARIRVMPSEGFWVWDFEGFKGLAVPPTWIRAFVKMKPQDLNGNTVMRMGPGKGRPSHMAWIGTPEMKNYEIKSDVFLIEENRQLASVGITNQRYNFVLDGNTSELQIRTWQSHLRMAKTIDYEADPDTWYVMKMIVDVVDGKAIVKGKVWKKSDEEPDEWTLVAEDPHPNLSGAPGVYVYGLVDCYFDNIQVKQRK